MDLASAMINSQVPHIENYKIIGRIGCGSYSVVYKAVKRGMNQLYAIKCYKNQFEKKENYQSVCKEIAMLSILRDPNIIQMEDFKIKHDLMYMITEYFPLGSLSDYVNAHKKRLMQDNLQRIVSQLASALVYMHSMNILHGDLKFQNVMITSAEGPKIKLIDFGLCDIFIDETTMLKRGGSMYSMAPEIHLNFPFNHTSDLFSLGVVMYQLVYGSTPFNNYEKEQLMVAYKKRKPIPFLENKVIVVGSEAMDLMKNLLSYDRPKRLSGEKLMRHPFINNPLYLQPCDHLACSKQLIEQSFDLAHRLQDHSSAYVRCMAAILHLKIYMGTNNDQQNRRKSQFLREKIKEYEDCGTQLREMIDQQRDKCPLGDQSDEHLKELCRSSPNLGTMINMGLAGEMYLLENRQDQALIYFNECVSGLMKLMATEPNGVRRTLVLKKMQHWIDVITYLTNKF